MSFFHILMFTIATGFITFVHKTLLAGKDNDEINIWIFCIIWPIITILSIALNIILLCW